MIFLGCACRSRQRILSSSRGRARCVSRPVILESAFQAFTATSPFVSGASARITSQASISVSILGASPLRPFSWPDELHLVLRVPGDPLPPLPTFAMSGPSEVKRL